MSTMAIKTKVHKKNIWLKKECIVLVLASLFFLFSTTNSYAEWLSYKDRKYKVQKNTAKTGYGVEVYQADKGQLLFVDQKLRKIKFKIDIGFDWTLKDFSSLPSKDKKEIIAFTIQKKHGGKFRYFNIKDGSGVFQAKHENQLVFDSKEKEETKKTITIIKHLNGSDSKVTESQYYRITSETQWQHIWESHAGKGSVPFKINFSLNMVIAIFEGMQVNSGSIRVVDIEETIDSLIVSYRQNIFKEWGGAIGTKPYGFFVIPKSRKKIIFREDIQPLGLVNGLPEWRINKELSPGKR